MNHLDLSDLPSLDEIESELASRSLYEFNRVSWPILNPTEPLIDGWHLQAISDHLQAVFHGHIQNLLITIAPRMSKSTLGSIKFTPWVWTQDPSWSFMYVSFSRDLASDHSVKCRRLIESSWYQRHWGHLFRLTSDQNEKMKFSNDKRGVREAYGMGGTTGSGARIIVVDDPHDVKDWTSPTKLKRTLDTYDASVHNRLNNPNDPRRVMIMQRISERDLGMHVARQGWEHLMLPTEYDPKRSKATVLGWKDPRQRPGELLCPKRFSAEQVRTEKEKRPRIFASQHQQNPSTDAGAIFKRNLWRFYSEDPRTMGQHMETQLQSWDCAFKDEPLSSMVAGQVWGKMGGNYFLLDRRLEHLSFVGTVAAVRAMTQLWPKARAKVIEDKANGTAVINTLKDEISGLIPWPPKGERMDSKIGRAWSVQPLQQAGNLYLPDPQKVGWVEEFIEYCASFPDAEFDDDVDALTQALQYIEQIPSSSAPLAVGNGTRWLK